MKTLQITKKSLENKAILTITAIFVLLFLSVSPLKTNASAPIASTNPVSIISSTKVVLHGYVNTGGLNTSYWFELNENGTIDSFGKRSRKTSGDVSASIVEIDPNITYSVRLVAQNNDGKSYGDTVTFSTFKESSGSNTNSTGNTSNNSTGSWSNTNTGSSVFGKTPIVSTTYATNVTDTGVSLNGYVDPNGGSGVYRWFEWGTSQSLGNISGTLSAGTNPNYFSHGISGLERNTLYYFRAGAHSNAGTVYGSIFSFTTGASNTSTSNIAPIILVKTPSYITSESAQLNATIIKGGATLTSGYFEWGPSQLFGNNTQPQTLQSGSSANMAAVLQNLKPNTEYSFRVVVQDSTNAVYRSQAITFRTTASSAGSAISTNINNKNNSSAQVGGTPAAVSDSNKELSPKTADTKSENTKTDSNVESGVAGAFFAKTSIAILGWFFSIILLMIVVVMGVMLRKNNKKENTEMESIGYKEFPDLPGHPVSK